MTDPPELPDAESCPECAAVVPPEAEACPACGARLFDRGPEEGRSEHFRQGEDQPVWDPIEALDEEGRLREPPVPDFEDLVTVFQGAMSEAMALRATLGARGFETYIRDDATKVIDPFITGGYAFSVSLDAPASDAYAILRSLAEDSPDEPPRELTPNEELEQRLEVLARGTIFATFLFLTAPIGLVLAARWMWLSRSYRGRPPNRARVALFSIVCLIETLALLAMTLVIHD
jgi:hypothetical protein